jgi:hypothetical protein
MYVIELCCSTRIELGCVHTRRVCCVTHEEHPTSLLNQLAKPVPMLMSIHMTSSLTYRFLALKEIKLTCFSFLFYEVVRHHRRSRSPSPSPSFLLRSITPMQETQGKWNRWMAIVGCGGQALGRFGDGLDAPAKP